MRAFLELVEADRFLLPEAELSGVDPVVLVALREAGIVREGDPGFAEVSAADLGRVLRKLYGVLSQGLALPSALDDRPVLLGWTGEGASRREVVLVVNPTRGLPWALRRPYRALVLVPTSRTLTEARRERHGKGAFVELEALEEALVVRGGRLARRGATTPERPASPATRAPAAAASLGEGLPDRQVQAAHDAVHAPLLAGAKRWNEVRICRVNDALLRVDLPGRSVRCTPVDVGMVNPRSRRATVTWDALITLCEASGYFHTTRFGGIAATKKVISRLRARLHELFDLRPSPFHRYRKGTGWQARFEARPDLPKEHDADIFRGLPGRARRVALGDIPGDKATDDVDFSD
jgi:hypothetical protein